MNSTLPRIRFAARLVRAAFFLTLATSFSASYARAAVSQAELTAGSLNNIGVALMNQQLTGKALVKFQAAHTADPASAIPVVNEGIAHLYLQQLPQATAALTQATRMDPANAHAWYALALAHLDTGTPKLAISDMEHVVKLDPDNADAHYFLGSFHMDLSQYPQAKAEYQVAIKLDPLHASARFGLARAMQRMKDFKDARAELVVFQHLVQSKIGSPLSAAYGGQGSYAKAEDMIAPPPTPDPMIPVHFDVQALPGGPAGGGACILGIQGPHSQDLVVMGQGANAIRAYKDVAGHYVELSASETGLEASGKAIACAVGDYDNDGKPDLAVAMSNRVILFRNLGNGHFANVTAKVGIQQLNKPSALTFIDYDHDGDLDLFITGTSTGHGDNVLWRNNGNGTFTDVTNAEGMAGTAPTTDVSLSDINNDRAVDSVVTGSGPSPTIYFNRREGPFRPMPMYADKGMSPTRGISVFDFNKDGWMDVALTHTGAPGVSLWRNVKGKSFVRVPLPITDATAGWGITPIDIDNDGWIDLAVLVQTAHGAELRILRNCGSNGFKDVSAQVGVSNLHLKDPRSLIAADVNNDGAADLILTQAAGPTLVLYNVGGNKNHSLRLNLTGLADNKTGIETKVEVFANGLWQKFEVYGGSGYLGQNSTEIIAGLGKVDHVDVVRLLWPTGVPQDEININPNQPVTLKELDRRGSSCPILFAWNGKKFQFISDVIGAAVVGHWVAPHKTNDYDPGEWIKVPGNDLKPKNGFYSLRFGEPMEEINYIDQIRLIAIDHPANTQVFPDERFLSEPPFASGKPIVVTPSAHPPVGAWNNSGQNVLPLLTKIDNRYTHGFKPLHYQGFTNLHSLTLNLGAWTPSHPLRLIMRGYVDYFSASSMYAAWQAGIQPIPPYVDALLPNGRWKRIINDMGFPAGTARTIIVNLTGKLPPGVRKIRLTTNLQIYWDQILVDNGASEQAEYRETAMPLANARLVFRGYPEQIEGKLPDEVTYNYGRISKTGPFHLQRGEYTNYGVVTPLLKSVNDHYVVFGSGEEIDARFNGAKLPPLPAGWKRDYFFYANGFVKDMDFYESMPYTVTQMPFHGMGTYPYPASKHYPLNEKSVAYLLNWNDRFISGTHPQRFEFNYRPADLQP